MKHPNAKGVPLVKICCPKIRFDRGLALAFMFMIGKHRSISENPPSSLNGVCFADEIFTEALAQGTTMEMFLIGVSVRITQSLETM
ncbi:hypothetical protein A2U01_0021620 [Trifolium medium]|uniref:Uncharacterized protein n=1 Tax=Trifolium medium TaxID=97028 RepID=A0A392NN06_9FABA|nr:hypothetical protein [Trifolium medium]